MWSIIISTVLKFIHLLTLSVFDKNKEAKDEASKSIVPDKASKQNDIASGIASDRVKRLRTHEASADSRG